MYNMLGILFIKFKKLNFNNITMTLYLTTTPFVELVAIDRGLVIIIVRCCVL